jgi:hypothetical protein
MADVELTSHARDMLSERRVAEEWLWRTIENPDRKKRYPDDGNMHYTKTIKEAQGRVLHVVVDDHSYPNRVVTVFFDRRLRKT